MNGMTYNSIVLVLLIALVECTFGSTYVVCICWMDWTRSKGYSSEERSKHLKSTHIAIDFTFAYRVEEPVVLLHQASINIIPDTTMNHIHHPAPKSSDFSRIRKPARTSRPIPVASFAVSQNMVTFFVHTRHVRLVIFVTFFQSLVPVLDGHLLALLGLAQSWDRTELVEYLVLLFEAESREEIFEIFDIELSFASFICDSK